MKIIDYPDAEAQAIALADRVASDLRAALAHKGHASLCLPGGTTPGLMLECLSAAPLDWAQVTVFAGDERWLPESAERSNSGQIRARLMRGPAAAAQMVSMAARGQGLAETAARLSERLAPHLPIDVLVLGMGPDLHVASLFPGAPELPAALAAQAPVVMALHPPTAAEPRLSLSARVLRGAACIHLLISGAEKRAALARAARLPETEAPVRVILNDARIHWTA
ncbi:6-phosphogluconolactonase [Phaeovulum vinaykumarii]|uniref:6-phosphogluconolactonase n=1 Tax=Phaeovulum vinaykumarii TaxID=407234 RepID=A0A1N7M3N0_9RHOB|nr:6-phosphogluconolactonase [Phaeovulum vinaykumarii]SIS80652.1 6-phosphogluconolactonase [Phaeovulum vinaykumarii]SOC09059.1 6-phosphogluconolactonase [Phaeovulum vinaykumarii]